MMTSLTRRKFLALTAGAGLAGVAGCSSSERQRAGTASTQTAPSTPSTSTAPITEAPTTAAVATPRSTAGTAASRASAAANDHVLIVVQLGGGNDGLNTLVPVDGRYHDARPTLGLADESLVAFPGASGYGLHSALAPLAPLLAAQHVAALEAIGYPHPNRSHFAALDDWWSGTPGASSTTGWLGRWLDVTATGDDDPLRAIALGAGVPALAAGKSRSTVVLSPNAFAFHPPKTAKSSLVATLAPTESSASRASSASSAFQPTATASPNELVAGYRQSMADAANAVKVFDALKAKHSDVAAASDSPAAGDVSKALAVAAQLVAEHPETRVIHVATGGFDTHANQLATQSKLLADVGAGIAQLFADLAKTGHDRRVLLMTVSEFGRRVHENGSGGTDHGKASVQFVVGPAVKGGVYGEADLAALDDGDLAPRIDVRSMYTLALDWLGTPTTDILDKRYESLGVL